MDANPRKAARLAAVLVVLAACSGGSGGGSDPGTDPGGQGPATAAEFCDLQYATLAQRYATCAKAALAWAQEFVDAGRLCANPVASVAAGRATYDRAAAGRCLASLEAASCLTLEAILDQSVDLPDCRAAVRGTVANGVTGSCWDDPDCASGRCSAVESQTCAGACYAGGAAGQSCTYNRDCAPGLQCYWGSLWPNQTCQPIANKPGQGQSCNLTVGCQPGLYCSKSSPSAAGTCQALATTGEPCISSNLLVNPTAPGYGCESQVAVALLGPGDACSVSPDRCGPGLYCGAGNVCREMTGVGEACAFNNGQYVGCIGGYCDVGGQCIQVYPDVCLTDWDCAPYGVCIGGACISYCAAP
jgi:hypothetical protein